MHKRAESWVQRFYDPCCDAYKRIGKELSAEFDAAVWAFWIEPFIMREVLATPDGYRASLLMELLLCAVGSPPESRSLLRVSQKDCCLAVRHKIYETWYDKLHHLPPRVNEALRAMSSFRALELRAAAIARGLPEKPTAEKQASEFTASTAGLLPEVPDSGLQIAATEAQEQTSAPLCETVPARAAEENQESRAPRARAPQAKINTSELAETTTPSPQEPAASGLQPLLAAPQVGANIPRLEKRLSSTAGECKWEDVEILFLSDERVQIQIGRTRETRNYAEFGFADNRSSNPSKAWETLRKLGELRGVIKNGTEAGLPWPRVEKRVQEIRKVFRKHFGIASDPIPFAEGVGYKARFKISCGPSFRT